ncbi:TIGR02680 family protein [Halostreptopolyspora alba]|uniref:TIGR02680 family protein n=1 Tax=Halostreptopolyspora alba TaxID=2487137 RepID=A0A3N0EI88_9ACTN|nr:TIGR02680 family protein [Nocardiopsaceae bacterium YIM 96095]
MSAPSDRFRPSRAGVINVWDYADEEFVFADGRLVLRGHNGSGKTKALEVLFPFVLDGVADARRLDPFSGENRTMKSNLLYRGQEAEYGYVWMEFARGGPTGTETVTAVIGLRAHRHQDGVRSSFYVTHRRLGVDFGLLAPDGRPLTEKQLRASLEPGAFTRTAAEYRDALDTQLFGLGRERYTQLLDLLLALRRPLLAKDLNPDRVSATLTSGLSPVHENLVTQAARDFENLAEVQQQFDDVSAADTAVRAFLADYTEYLRLNATSQLRRVREARRTAAGHAHKIAEASADLRAARREREQATEEQRHADTELEGLRRQLAALKQDDAYRAHGEIELQRGQLATAKEEITRETERLERVDDHIRQLETEADEAEERLDELRASVDRNARALLDAAELAGIDNDGDGPVDTGEDLPTTAKARARARRDDVAAVSAELQSVRQAEQQRATAETKLEQAREATTEREREAEDAEQRLAGERARAREALGTWVERWTSGSDPVAAPEDGQALTETLDRVGEPKTPTLAEVFSRRTQDRRDGVAARREQAKAQSARIAEERERLGRERDEVAAERDDAPAANDLRTADRSDRPGAPLWQLVRFADSVDDETAAGIEGALYGAGLLTAWVHPEPEHTRAAVAAAEADGYLRATGGVQGPSLADVLLPEEQDLVPRQTVIDVLASIALAEEGEELLDPGTSRHPVVTPRAQFSYGPHLGARPKPAPEYIGATNRAHRRRARLETYDSAIAELTRRQSEADAELERLGALLTDFHHAREELPSPEPVLTAVHQVAQAATLLRAARDTQEQRRGDLDASVAEVDARGRRLRQVATERAMPATAEGVDTVAGAVDDFAATAERLHGERARSAAGERDLVERRTAIARQRERHNEDSAALEAKKRDHRAAEEEFTAREHAMGASVREVLTQVTEIEEQRIPQARTRVRDAERRTSQEHDRAVRAETVVESQREALGEALGHLFERAQTFAPYAHGELRPLLGVSTELAWPAGAEWPEPREAATALAGALTDPDPGNAPDPAGRVTAVLPDGVAELLDTFGDELGAAERTVSENALKNASSTMSTALRTFQEALDSCSGDYRLDHDPTGVVTVHVHDEAGRSPVAAFARRIADRVEEQGQLLEERERTVLEDELLSGLAQQIHDRVLTARDLVAQMNRDTRSRPMSSGTQIGIRWGRSDRLSDNQRAAASLLERDARGLGPSGLAELRGLLREMIRDYRATHPRATYRQALAEVLDYRAWYTFELRLAVPGQSEVKLTKAKHEEMSGGEKSAAIHLPLFAAANALYGSARPSCPRVIALDEAFAGIDDRYKPELLGLTVTFELDLFMTGHDLWVHYDTVPMAAHYDMHHDKSAHAVSAMLMLWDGEATVDADAGFAGNEELATSLLGITPRRYVPDSDEGTLLAAPVGDDNGGEHEDRAGIEVPPDTVGDPA